MKFLAHILLFTLPIACFSQANTNIVPDSGFEMLKPCYDTGVYYSLGSIEWMKYWQNGNEGSTDFYMAFTCTPSNTSLANYPNSSYGNQYPRTGNCYAGIVAIAKPTLSGNLREYLRTPLLIPLEAGKKYYAGCYASLGESFKRYSINNLGLLFSNGIPTYDSIYLSGQWYQNGPINEVPQVMNDTTFNLNDTLGWVLVADTFVAQGGEQWLTIGNFRDDAHSIIVPTGYTTDVNDSASYYFVDDVFIYCIDTACAIVPTIGVKEHEREKGFKVYPNPSSGKFTIEYPLLKEEEKATLSIYTLEGKKLTTIKLSAGTMETSFELNNLANGVYMYKVERNSIVLTTNRLIIMK